MKYIQKLVVPMILIGLVSILAMGCVESSVNKGINQVYPELEEYKDYRAEYNRFLLTYNDMLQDDRIYGKEKVEFCKEYIEHLHMFVNFISENEYALSKHGIDTSNDIGVFEKAIKVLEKSIDINDGDTYRIEYRDGGFERFYNVVDIALLKQGTFSHTIEIVLYDGNARTLHYVVDYEIVR